ncbi:MAG: CPBP family intramembrane metalloprotease [Gemmataceae bacterium]|nr:CPBP family intramembrane metalloprotease [Gemmataceae bacterium]
MASYLAATRHPWAAFLFVVPLLAAYEAGVVWLGGDDPARLRNGADGWVRVQLGNFGLAHHLIAPAAVALLLLLRAWWRWADRPADPIPVWFGQVFESGLFAIVLWQFGQNFGSMIDRTGIRLDVTVGPGQAARVLTFVGAGIYEEVIFRLGLFGGLCLVLRMAHVPTLLGVPLAALAGAAAFAAAHHLVPGGEPLNPAVFLFRTAAGLYFTTLYVARGFGVAVGAHAGYDVLIGTSG